MSATAGVCKKDCISAVVSRKLGPVMQGEKLRSKKGVKHPAGMLRYKTGDILIFKRAHDEIPEYPYHPRCSNGRGPLSKRGP